MIRRTARALSLACFCWLLFGCQAARADDCSASGTDVVFGAVSPVAGSDYYATGSITVTCTWTIVGGLAGGTSAVVLPNATVCINLGLGSPSSGATRRMGNGGALLQYELYRDSTYAAGSGWGGGPGMPSSALPLATTFVALLAQTTQSQTFPVYARIPAAAFAGIAPAATPYVASYAGAASISYSFSTLLANTCTAGGRTASFSFQVRASVVNDCLIGAGDLAFGSRGVLSGAARATSAMTVKCSLGTPYQVALGGGTVGNLQSGRMMKNAVTGEKLAYQISRSLDGPVWGDGVGITDVLSGVGIGATQTVNVYGSVPQQATPSTGTYQDRVTATVIF